MITSNQGIVGDPSALPAGMDGVNGVDPQVYTGSTTPTYATNNTSSSSVANNANVVAGLSVDSLVADRATDPGGFMDDLGANLSDNVPTMTGNETGTNLTGSEYGMNVDGLSVNAETGTAATASDVNSQDAATYDAATTFNDVNDNLGTAATMDTNEDAIINPDDITIDEQGVGTGVNADGSINQTGVALNDFAHQNISTVIDTSTISGKILAQTLGEGNYLDSKATVKGQLEILTKEFVDADGNPKVPTWAAGIMRNVNRTFAFTGVTGTAAISAATSAMIEATLPIAQADSKFYQTVTLKNLDNKQQQIINKANVLSKMDLANLDTRTTIAVTNAKTFMQYDMANLANEQQMSVINTQAKVQSILEDANQTNVARRFGAEATNEMNKFYDNLGASIDMYNTGQKNQMSQFNVGEVNQANQFNASLENAREQFYMKMQYAVDAANAKWRQTVTLTNSEMEFQAAATDVKNMLGLTTEALNQLWDRSDSLLDYAWKEGENEKDRELRLEVAKMELQAARDASKAKGKSGLFGAVGSLLGSKAGSSAIMGGISKAVGFIGGLFSDQRLKSNIQQYGTLDNGVKLYTWDWNEVAIGKGIGGLPTYGVLAQDVQKQFPEAVYSGPDGYLRVDYNKVAA